MIFLAISFTLIHASMPIMYQLDALGAASIWWKIPKNDRRALLTFNPALRTMSNGSRFQ
jgi:hypothetical protein